ncbi:MAG: oxygen-independent coproporphyrinogen III oxidase [Pseudomonadota bacterium]
MIQSSQLAKFGLFDARVPRYTSYPTAPQFSEDVGPGHFVNWISQLPEQGQISLYVHIPFCRRLCWFCACRTQGTQSDKPVISYLETLKSELALLKQHLPEGIRLQRLHWGGGTPTLLRPDMMADLAFSIAQMAPFADSYEFSVEIDPNEIDAARVHTLAAAGMNRASIGVQDFNDDIQQTIGRIQSYDVTRNAVEMLRGHGISSLNADILFGLPNQTQKRMTESVQKLLSLNPDRVALYGYAHVPWMARRQTMIPSDALPTPEERLVLFDTARRLFLWDGYREIGIDHFASPEDSMTKALDSGHLRRNFQGYTDDVSGVLIGVGASAISKFPQGYAQNDASTGKHVGAISKGQFSTARGHVFKGDDKLRARMIEALMCDFRINSAELKRIFGVSDKTLNSMYSEATKAFPGMIEVNEDGLFLQQRSRPLTRMIARIFDTYNLGQSGHSSAI